MAFILAPIQAVESVLDDMAASGIRNGVVLAAGYREVGEEGRALEDAMVAKAIEHGIVLLGPNCLGFLNAQSKSPVFALGHPPAADGRAGRRRPAERRPGHGRAVGRPGAGHRGHAR